MMNEHERLVELLKNAKKYATNIMIHSTIDEVIDTSYDDLLVNYLLENGVVVLPCKVGDTVYYASKSYTSFKIKPYAVYEAEVVRMTYTQLGLIIIIRMKIEDGFAEIPYVHFGKDIFLTKEEAEQAIQALKGGIE